MQLAYGRFELQWGSLAGSASKRLIDDSVLDKISTRFLHEDGLPENSTWATGDWNGDREFDTADLILALQDAGYEQGPRSGVIAVPEPSAIILVFFATFPLTLVRPGARSGTG